MPAGIIATMKKLAFVLLLLACESDAKKLDKLRSERSAQCLLAEAYAREGDTTYQDAPARCKAATRRYEEFVAKH